MKAVRSFSRKNASICFIRYDQTGDLSSEKYSNSFDLLCILENAWVDGNHEIELDSPSFVSALNWGRASFVSLIVTHQTLWSVCLSYYFGKYDSA